MASIIFPVSTLINFQRFTTCKPKAATACKSVITSAAETTKLPVPAEPIVRRSANYKPCLYDNNFLQSMKTEFKVIYLSVYVILLLVSLYMYSMKVTKNLNRVKLSMHELLN